MYCTRCGKKLEEGEVCTCRQNDTVKMQPQAQMPKQATAPQQQAPKQTSAPQQQIPKETVTSKIQMPGQAAPQNTNYQQGANYQQNANYRQNANYQQNMNYQQNPNYQSANRTGNMQNEADWVKEKGNVAAANAKSFVQSAVQVLKKPIYETVRMVNEGSGKEGIRFIIVKGILLTILALISTLITAARAGGSDMSFVGLTVFMLLFTIGADFLEAILMKAFTSAFKGVTTANSMYTVIGVRAVYDMLIGLVAVILSLISSALAICVCGLAVMFLPCIQYASYRVAIQADENKKAYAFAVAKICVTVILVIVMLVIGASILGSALGRLGNIFGSSSYYGW